MQPSIHELIELRNQTQHHLGKLDSEIKLIQDKCIHHSKQSLETKVKEHYNCIAIHWECPSCHYDWWQTYVEEEI
jgi:lipopolysaccharide biosynthesis regulator YciM